MTGFADIGNDASVSGGVNLDELTALYKDGRQVLVVHADVDVWLAEGWSREATDPRAALGELGAMAQALVDALRALVDEADFEGELDPDGALAVAQTALSQLAALAQNVLLAIQQRYPMQEGESVAVDSTDADGNPVTVQVDPNQVAQYQA